MYFFKQFGKLKVHFLHKNAKLVKISLKFYFQIDIDNNIIFWHQIT